MIAGIFLLATVASGYGLEAGVTPIEKVTQMMQEMVAKGKQEKHDEQVRFSAFKQFCVDTTDQKQDAIQNAADEIEQLTADITKAQADQSRLSEEIAVLDTNIGQWEADKAAAAADRAAEKAAYDELHADYSESIDALGRAVMTLSKQTGDTKQGTSLLQKVSTLARLPAQAKKTILAFLDTSAAGPLDVSAPEANAYEFQSGGIVEMLEKLEDKFKKELDGYVKEEMNSKHAHQMLDQELHDQIEEANRQREEKTKVKAQRASDEATAKGDKATTQEAKAADEKYLKDLIIECGEKSRSFEQRQMLRAEEIEAVGKAIDIIQSPDVAGSGSKHLPSLLQMKTKTSMVLLRSSTAPLRKAVSFLAAKAKSTKSHLLALMATKAQDSPFDKVKKMIKDMIVKLMEEANSESEHKGWCDTEMSVNGQTRETKSDTVSTLTADSDELNAKITKLGTEIAELSNAVAELDQAVSEATALRQEEKAKNEATIVDAQAAQVAVAKALTVLKEFYAKADEATALVQGAADDAPETFDEPYTGMGGSAGGVVGMIEVIESDFARLEADTSTAESEAQAEFEKFSDDSAQDKAVKNMDTENKSKDKTSAESDLNDTKKDLLSTQTELDAALAYYEKLKPSCVDAGLSYEDRVRGREEEIQSLQEALQILSGEAI